MSVPGFPCRFCFRFRFIGPFRLTENRLVRQIPEWVITRGEEIRVTDLSHVAEDKKTLSAINRSTTEGIRYGLASDAIGAKSIYIKILISVMSSRPRDLLLAFTTFCPAAFPLIQ